MSRREIGKVGYHFIRTSLLHLSSYMLLGYNPPQNLQHYSVYLDSRIRAYRELKHDAVRVQSESNRDWRNSNSIEEDSSRDRRHTGDKPTTSSLAKTKTTVGRKLGVMSVEKGLLRETKIVQRMIDTLVECRVRLYSVHGQSLEAHVLLPHSFTWTT